MKVQHIDIQQNNNNKRNEILPFEAAQMDLDDKQDKSDKDKYNMISLIYGILKKRINITKQKQSHRYREQAGSCQSGTRSENERNM